MFSSNWLRSVPPGDSAVLGDAPDYLAPVNDDRRFEEHELMEIFRLAAGSSASVTCPYCGEEVELSLDPSGGASQRYVEDCEVCCRPWQLTISWDSDGAMTVEAQADDD
jgi:hypothetical protein